MKRQFGDVVYIPGAVILFLALYACSQQRENVSPMPSISARARMSMAKPVDCKSARHDISVLEDERASVGQQTRAGVRSVFPASAVAGILSGDYEDRVEVATGQYNQDLDEKINAIRTRCGLR